MIGKSPFSISKFWKMRKQIGIILVFEAKGLKSGNTQNEKVKGDLLVVIKFPSGKQDLFPRKIDVRLFLSL